MQHACISQKFNELILLHACGIYIASPVNLASLATPRITNGNSSSWLYEFVDMHVAWLDGPSGDKFPPKFNIWKKWLLHEIIGQNIC